MRRILYLLGLIFLVGLFAGCQKTIVYADPILAEPGEPISPFVQQVPWWSCAPNPVCTQTTFIQTFQWVVPNVAQGDSLKVTFVWFVGQALNQLPVVTDSAGSIYTLVQEQDLFQQKYGFIFSTPQVNSNGNDVTVIVTLPFSTPNEVDLDALEYSAGFNPDGANGAENFNWLPIQTGPIQVSGNADVLLSIYFGTMTPVSVCPACNARYISGHSTHFMVEDFFPPSSGSYSASFSAPNPTGTWAVVAASFQ